MYKEERDVLEEDMRKIDERDIEKFGTLDSSEKTIAILGDRWWPQTAKLEGEKISKKFTIICNTWRKRNERPHVRNTSIRSRNGAPSRKGCVVNGQMTKASNKCVPRPRPLIMLHGASKSNKYAKCQCEFNRLRGQYDSKLCKLRHTLTTRVVHSY